MLGIDGRSVAVMDTQDDVRQFLGADINRW
jgi:hypothetical protein